MMSSRELGFTANVDRQFLRAVNLLDLPPGLAQQIRICNATYTVRFPVRLRERIHVFTGYRLFTPITSTQSKVVFVTLWPLIRMRSRRLLP